MEPPPPPSPATDSRRCRLRLCPQMLETASGRFACCPSTDGGGGGSHVAPTCDDGGSMAATRELAVGTAAKMVGTLGSSLDGREEDPRNLGLDEVV